MADNLLSLYVDESTKIGVLSKAIKALENGKKKAENAQQQKTIDERIKKYTKTKNTMVQIIDEMSQHVKGEDLVKFKSMLKENRAEKYDNLSITIMNDFMDSSKKRYMTENELNPEDSLGIKILKGETGVDYMSVVKTTIATSAVAVLAQYGAFSALGSGLAALMAFNPVVGVCAIALGGATLIKYARKLFAPEIKKILDNKRVKEIVSNEAGALLEDEEPKIENPLKDKKAEEITSEVNTKKGELKQKARKAYLEGKEVSFDELLKEYSDYFKDTTIYSLNEEAKKEAQSLISDFCKEADSLLKDEKITDKEEKLNELKSADKYNDIPDTRKDKLIEETKEVIKKQEEAKKKAEEEAQRKADEEAKRKADEEKRKADEEAKRKADEEKRKADEEAKRKADEEAKAKAEEEKKLSIEARKNKFKEHALKMWREGTPINLDGFNLKNLWFMKTAQIDTAEAQKLNNEALEEFYKEDPVHADFYEANLKAKQITNKMEKNEKRLKEIDSELGKIDYNIQNEQRDHSDALKDNDTKKEAKASANLTELNQQKNGLTKEKADLLQEQKTLETELDACKNKIQESKDKLKGKTNTTYSTSRVIHANLEKNEKDAYKEFVESFNNFTTGLINGTINPDQANKQLKGFREQLRQNTRNVKSESLQRIFNSLIEIEETLTQEVKLINDNGHSKSDNVKKQEKEEVLKKQLVEKGFIEKGEDGKEINQLDELLNLINQEK